MRDDRLLDLLDAHLDGRLTPPEADELRAILRSSPEARERYWAYVEQQALLRDVLAEARGADLAFVEERLTAPSPPPHEQAPAARRRRPLRWVALAAVAAVLLSLTLGFWPRREGEPDPAPRAAPFATIQAVAGDVRVSDGSGPPSLASAGSPLSPGQKVHVGDEESQAEILFADGTLLSVGSGSALRLSATAEGKRILLDAGAVQLDAPGRADRPVVVTAGQAVVTATDARFRLYREPGACRVEVERGKVRLDNQGGGPPVEVAEGSYALVPDEPLPMQTQQMPLGHARLRHTFLRGGDAVCFSGDGRRLLASHFDRGLKAWGTDGELLASAPGGGQRADGLAVSGAGAAVALGNRGAVTLWKIGEEQPSQIQLRQKELRGGAISSDGRWIAQGTAGGEVALWEADPEKGTISHRRSLSIKPSRVALASVGPHVAVSRWGGEIHVFDVETGRQVSQYKLRRIPTPLALSDDARFVAAYAISDGLVVFDRRTGERRVLWPGEGARVSHLCFSRDGSVLLVGLDDGTVRAWSAADGRPLLVLDTGHRHVNKVAANADLSLLATVGDNDCVKVWQVTLP